MFHMLTCFDLKPGCSIKAFSQSRDDFVVHMQALDLLSISGPVGRRQRHPVMDTDAERDHEYFFVMSFRDREQCDRAVAYIEPGDEPADSIHKQMYEKITDPVFICWEDIE